MALRVSPTSAVTKVSRLRSRDGNAPHAKLGVAVLQRRAPPITERIGAVANGLALSALREQ